MITIEALVALYHERKSRMAPVHSKMIRIKNLAENHTDVPLPELDKNEVPAVANLLSQGIDQYAMRIASSVPSISYPPTKPGNASAEDYARIRRLANYGWWEANRFSRQLYKRARYLVAYATTPAIIRPDFKLKIPRWQLPDPLTTFPAPLSHPDDICPDNVILAYRRHLSWLQSHYPQAAAAIELGKDPSPDTELEVLEYQDSLEHVMVAIGRPPESTNSPFPWQTRGSPGLPFLQLERFPNKVGRCTFTYPTRPSLDAPLSQFDAMPDVHRMQARAMALWMIANDRATFPDIYAISRQSEQVDIVNTADGRAGTVGEIRGGDLHVVETPPNPQVANMLQMLERNQRVTAGLSPQMGGEEPSQVRTGRAGEQLLGATIDYGIQEAHDTLSLTLQEENKLAIAVDKAFFGDTPKTFYVNFQKTKGQVDYTPNVHFDTDNNVVSWPIAGSDINQLVVGLGQRLGLDEISVYTAQGLDPYVDDREEEQRLLTAQSVDKAFMAAIDQQVASGQIGANELSTFAQKILTGQNKFKAWDEVHQEAQQAQAASQQSPQAGGPAPGSPEAQPGVAAPGQIAAQGLPGPGPSAGVTAPQPGLAHMQQLMGALNARAKGP